MKTCSRCKEEKPFSEFYRAKERKDGYRHMCKPCCNIAHRESYHRNKNGGWSDRTIEYTRRNNIRKRYKITPEEYDAIVGQDACEICGVEGVRLHLDHCHVSGKVRGGLCRNCNIGLGLFQDSPNVLANALEYLNTHKQGAA